MQGGPSCGYDFPEDNDDRTGIAYSTWADIALMVGGLVAGFSCVAAILYSVGMLVQGQFMQGLVAGPVAFFWSLALLVVFLRIQKV
jgi:hypothetical protein